MTGRSMSGRGMIVSLIAAVAENGVIGSQGDLPWRIRDDMRFFMRTTRDHWVVTGRRNFEAMGLLKHRTHVVVSRNADYEAVGAHLVSDVASGLRLAAEAGETEAFVIGGAQIYALAFPYAHRFYRTVVHGRPSGDVFFPSLNVGDWSREILLECPAGEDNDFACTAELLRRPTEPESFL